MFIGSTQEKDVAARVSHVSGDDVTCEGGVGVSDVRFVVDIVDRCSDFEWRFSIVKGCGGNGIKARF